MTSTQPLLHPYNWLFETQGLQAVKHEEDCTHIYTSCLFKSTFFSHRATHAGSARDIKSPLQATGYPGGQKPVTVILAGCLSDIFKGHWKEPPFPSSYSLLTNCKGKTKSYYQRLH